MEEKEIQKRNLNILKKYKEEGYKLIKTKNLEHKSLTIDSRVFKAILFIKIVFIKKPYVRIFS